MRYYAVRFRVFNRDELLTVAAHDATDAVTIAATKMVGMGYSAPDCRIVDIEAVEPGIRIELAEKPS